MYLALRAPSSAALSSRVKPLLLTTLTLVAEPDTPTVTIKPTEPNSPKRLEMDGARNNASLALCSASTVGRVDAIVAAAMGAAAGAGAAAATGAAAVCGDSDPAGALGAGAGLLLAKGRAAGGVAAGASCCSFGCSAGLGTGSGLFSFG